MIKKKILLEKNSKSGICHFFMYGSPHDLAQKTENVPKWAYFDNI